MVVMNPCELIEELTVVVRDGVDGGSTCAWRRGRVAPLTSYQTSLVILAVDRIYLDHQLLVSWRLISFVTLL